MLELPHELTLLEYFGFMVGSMLLSQPMAPPTLIAVKTAAPWLVASVAAAASIITANIDHQLFRRVFALRRLNELRSHKLFVRAEAYAKVAPFLTTFAFAALPLPFMIVRVLMPLCGYPLHRYVAAIATGRFARMFVVASFGTVVEIPTRVLVWFWIGGVSLSVVGYVLKRLGVFKPPPTPTAASPVENPPPTSSSP